jgi:hypothetical protein
MLKDIEDAIQSLLNICLYHGHSSIPPKPHTIQL